MNTTSSLLACGSRLVCYSLAVLVLAPAVGAQCSIEWDQPVSGLWGTAANWSENRIPGDSDTVCITTGGDYTVELRGPRTVAGVIVGDGTTPTTPGPTLELSRLNGHLTVTNTGEIRGSGRLLIDLTNGTPGNFGILDGAGDITIIGQFDWRGEVRGTGAFVAEGPTVMSRSPRLRGRVARIMGDIDVAANSGLSLFEEATFENHGTMIWGGGTRGVEEPGSSVPGTFVNVGTLRQEGTGVVPFDVPVENSGTIEVASGRVEFRKDSDHRGASFLVADGARLEFSNQNIAGVHPVHSVDGATTANVEGTLAVLKGSVLAVTADWTIAGVIELEPGAGEAWLTGDGDITTPHLVWGVGTVITGDGALVVTGDNPATVADQRGGILRGRTLTVSGTLTLSSLTTFESGGRLEVGGTGEVVLLRGIRQGDRGGTLVNGGDLTIGSRLDVGVLLESSGTIALASGVQSLTVRDGLNCLGGSLDVDSGQEIHVSGSVGTFDGCTLIGPGRLVARDGGEISAVGAGLTIADGAEVSTTATDDVLSGTGTFTISAGSITSRGSIRPGASPGVLSIDGDLTQTNGRVEIELGGLVPGAEYDQLVTSSTFAFDGTLAVSLVNGFFPIPGQRFVIATCGACVGTFHTVEPPPGFSFDVNLSATEIALVVTGAVDREAPPPALDPLSLRAPNPATGASWVTVRVSTDEPVHVTVHDALGRLIARLHSGPLAMGVDHRLRLDTEAWPPGRYTILATAQGVQSTQPLTVVH